MSELADNIQRAWTIWTAFSKDMGLRHYAAGVSLTAPDRTPTMGTEIPVPPVQMWTAYAGNWNVKAPTPEQAAEMLVDYARKQVGSFHDEMIAKAKEEIAKHEAALRALEET